MEDTLTVKIGEGLGNIKFGMSKPELEALMGKPDEADQYNASGEEDGYLTESWHYDELEFSVSFDEEDNWRLTTIATSSPDAKLMNKAMMGLSKEEVLEQLNNSNFGTPETEDLSDDHIQHELVSFMESSLNLWFEDGKLSEIQWGVLWESEDTPKWPS